MARASRGADDPYLPKATAFGGGGAVAAVVCTSPGDFLPWWRQRCFTIIIACYYNAIRALSSTRRQPRPRCIAQHVPSGWGRQPLPHTIHITLSSPAARNSLSRSRRKIAALNHAGVHARVSSIFQLLNSSSNTRGSSPSLAVVPPSRRSTGRRYPVRSHPFPSNTNYP